MNTTPLRFIVGAILIAAILKIYLDGLLPFAFFDHEAEFSHEAFIVSLGAAQLLFTAIDGHNIFTQDRSKGILSYLGKLSAAVMLILEIVILGHLAYKFVTFPDQVTLVFLGYVFAWYFFISSIYQLCDALTIKPTGLKGFPSWRVYDPKREIPRIRRIIYFITQVLMAGAIFGAVKLKNEALIFWLILVANAVYFGFWLGYQNLKVGQRRHNDTGSFKTNITQQPISYSPNKEKQLVEVVVTSSVSLEQGSVTHDENISLTNLETWVKELGYKLEPIEVPKD